MTSIEQAPSPGIARKRVLRRYVDDKADAMLKAAQMMEDIRDEHEDASAERVVLSNVAESKEITIYFR